MNSFKSKYLKIIKIFFYTRLKTFIFLIFKFKNILSKSQNKIKKFKKRNHTSFIYLSISFKKVKLMLLNYPIKKKKL